MAYWTLLDWVTFVIATAVLAPIGFTLGHRYMRWTMRLAEESIAIEDALRRKRQRGE